MRSCRCVGLAYVNLSGYYDCIIHLLSRYCIFQLFKRAFLGIWSEPALTEALALETMLALGVNPDTAEEVDATERHTKVVSFFKSHWEEYYDEMRAPIWGETLTRMVTIDALTSFAPAPRSSGASDLSPLVHSWSDPLKRVPPAALGACDGALRLFRDASSRYSSRVAQSADLSRDRHYENAASDVTDRSQGGSTRGVYVPWIKRVVSDIIRQREFTGEDGRPTRWTTAHDVNYLSSRAVSKHSVADAKKRATRFVVFVAGGITHSEIRRLKELTSEIPGVVITIGSTALATPCSFLHQLDRYRIRSAEDQLWLNASAQGQALSAARGQL